MAAIYLLTLKLEPLADEIPVPPGFHTPKPNKMAAISLLTLTLEPLVNEPKTVPP